MNAKQAAMAQKQATARKSDAARMAHMVRRIRAQYALCTVQDLADGIAWYDRAAIAALGMAGFDMLRAAGVIAALSPRCAWTTNLSWARAMLAAAIDGSSCPAVHTTTMRGQAWKIANGHHALSVLGGPKVRSFFANITGDHNAVTVDVWAARVAEGWKSPQPDAVSRVAKNRRKTGTGSIATTGKYKSDPSPTGKRYAMIANAYRAAALAESATSPISARDLQAAVWTSVRGSAL